MLNECAYCTRLFDCAAVCPDCKLQLPNTLAPGEKVYGFDVAIAVMDGALATKLYCYHRKGREAAVRYSAKFKRGFVRIVQLNPFTEEQWLRCYGEGRM